MSYELEFEPSSSGRCPAHAVPGGTENGETLYIARAQHGGSIVPGKLHCSHRTAYIPYGGQEHRKTNYEILCFKGQCGTSLEWVNASHGAVPSGALKIGKEANGVALYAARAFIENDWTPGKVNSQHKVCYVPWGGKEHAFSSYQVLCVRGSVNLC